jgi:hypothetical protein
MSLGSLQDGGLRIVELSCRGSTLQVYGFQWTEWTLPGLLAPSLRSHMASPLHSCGTLLVKAVTSPLRCKVRKQRHSSLHQRSVKNLQPFLHHHCLIFLRS